MILHVGMNLNLTVKLDPLSKMIANFDIGFILKQKMEHDI